MAPYLQQALNSGSYPHLRRMVHEATDPDANELYFPYPTSLATGSLITSNPEQPR